MNYKKILENQDLSEEEIIKKLPEDKIKKIEDMIAKKFGKKVDLDKPSSENVEKPTENKSNESEDEVKNEAAGIAGVIAMASLIPLALEAAGGIVNTISAKTGINLSKEQWKEYRIYNAVIKAYKELLDREFCDLHWAKKTYRFKWENWKELGKKADELLKKETGGESNFAYKGNESKHESFRYLKKYEGFYNTINEADNSSKKSEVEAEIKRISKIRDQKYGTELGKKLIEAGHKMHSAYTWPIRVLLKGVSVLYPKSWIGKKENRKIAANIIYACVMIGFTGKMILEHMGHLEGIKQYSEMIIKFYKTGYTGNDLAKEVLGAISGESVGH